MQQRQGLLNDGGAAINSTKRHWWLWLSQRPKKIQPSDTWAGGVGSAMSTCPVRVTPSFSLPSSHPSDLSCPFARRQTSRTSYQSPHCAHSSILRCDRSSSG